MPIQKITPGVVDTSVFSSPTISSPTLTTPTVSGNLSLDSTGTTGLNTATANTVRVHTAGTERVRVTSTGDVGIGTTSPAGATGFTADRKILHIIPSSGTANAQVRLGGTSGTIIDHDDSNNTITTIRNLYGASSASAAMQLQSGYMTFGTGTSYTERMRIDSNGYVTKPFQPMMYASGSGGTTGGSANPIILTANLLNIGSNYNTGNGRFTAPIAGRYQAIFTALKGSSGGGDFHIRKNGTVVINGYGAGDVATSATHIILELAAGDYITFSLSSGTFYTDYTSYSVQLVS